MKRKILATVVLPLISIAALVAYLLAVADRLPEQVATHWSGAGVADGFTDRDHLAVLFGGITAIVAGLMAAMAFTAGRGAVVGARALYGAALGVAWFIGALGVWTAYVQLDGAATPSLPGAAIPLALALGALGWVLGSWVSGSPGPIPKTAGAADAGAQRQPLPEGRTAVWVGHTPPSTPLVVVAVGVAALAGSLGALASWWLLLLMVPVLLLVIASAKYTVTLGPTGLRVAGAIMGFPRVSVPMDEISHVEAGTVDALSFGGWGIRLAGETAVITRSGPALVVTRTDGAILRVSLDDPAEPAAVMATLMDRRA